MLFLAEEVSVMRAILTLTVLVLTAAVAQAQIRSGPSIRLGGYGHSWRTGMYVQIDRDGADRFGTIRTRPETVLPRFPVCTASRATLMVYPMSARGSYIDVRRPTPQVVTPEPPQEASTPQSTPPSNAVTK